MSCMKVFIVEDEERVGIHLQLMVEAAGASVCGRASDSKAFYAALASSGADIVLLDWFLVETTGREVIEFVKLHGNIPVLVITGKECPEICREALSCGACGFITKLDALCNIKEALEYTKNRRSYISEEMMDEFRKEWDEGARRKAEEAREALTSLTPREIEVLDLLEQGSRGPEIAVKLGIGLTTVYTHKGRAMSKLGAKSTVDLVHKYSDFRARSSSL